MKVNNVISTATPISVTNSNNCASSTSSVNISSATTENKTRALAISASTTASTTYVVNSSSTNIVILNSSTTLPISSSTTTVVSSTSPNISSSTTQYNPYKATFITSEKDVKGLMLLEDSNLIKDVYDLFEMGQKFTNRVKELNDRTVLNTATYNLGEYKVCLPYAEIKYFNDLSVAEKVSGGELIQVDTKIQNNMELLNDFINENATHISENDFYVNLSNEIKLMLDSQGERHLFLTTVDGVNMDINLSKLENKELDVIFSVDSSISESMTLTTGIQINMDINDEIPVTIVDENIPEKPPEIYEVGSFWEEIDWEEAANSAAIAAGITLPIVLGVVGFAAGGPAGAAAGFGGGSLIFAR